MSNLEREILRTEIVRKLTPSVIDEANEDVIVDDAGEHPSQHRWTWYLLFCCLTAAIASFQFGYNVASLNSVTQVCNLFASELEQASI